MIGEVIGDLLESRALRRWAPVIAFGVAAVVSCCVCCTGGLFDALSPQVASGFLSAVVGTGVGMAGPRLGDVVLVFDKATHRYTGAVILSNGQTAFSAAILRTAVVARAGEPPG